MIQTTPYWQEREDNIARNKRLLDALGVAELKPKTEPKETRHTNRKQSKQVAAAAAGKKRKKAGGGSDSDSDWESNSDGDEDGDERPTRQRANARTRKTARTVAEDDENENVAPQDSAVPTGGRRRSSRIAGKPADAMARVERSRGTPHPISVKALVEDGLAKSVKRERRYNPKTYGAIPGIEAGSWWASREECSNDAVHAPWVGGISPGPDGAYSIALSGGYDDDVDGGYAFTYTGAGGRDLKGTKAAPKNLRTAEQSFDQSFEHNHNRALQRSVTTGKPVRVIRGFKLRSKYGPSEGYRYDGLYLVKKAWQEKGLNKDGFLVCKYAFVRLPDQPPIPVKNMGGDEFDETSDREGDAAHED